MSCTVRIASPLRSYTNGVASLEIEGATIAEVLAGLESRCPGIRFRMIDEQERIRPHVRLFVNEQAAASLAAPVTRGDTLHIICALSGG